MYLIITIIKTNIKIQTSTNTISIKIKSIFPLKLIETHCNYDKIYSIGNIIFSNTSRIGFGISIPYENIIPTNYK